MNNSRNSEHLLYIDSSIQPSSIKTSNEFDLTGVQYENGQQYEEIFGGDENLVGGQGTAYIVDENNQHLHVASDTTFPGL